MPKMTLEELRKLRDTKRTEIQKRESEGKTVEIVVGMSTCGIAAGAKEALDAFLDSVEKHHLSNVVIKQTSCMGLCAVEPTVRVTVPGMPVTLYGKVDRETAKAIMEQHVLEKRLINEHVYDEPSVDMLGQTEGK